MAFFGTELFSFFFCMWQILQDQKSKIDLGQEKDQRHSPTLPKHATLPPHFQTPPSPLIIFVHSLTGNSYQTIKKKHDEQFL